MQLDGPSGKARRDSELKREWNGKERQVDRGEGKEAGSVLIYNFPRKALSTYNGAPVEKLISFRAHPKSSCRPIGRVYII